MTKNIDLGFAEPFTDEWLSKEKYFPSKIGGRPSFLVLNPILGSNELNCSKCNNTLRFILQLYAPIESDDNAFHRHLFVFGCGQQSQCSNEFRVFRCQLPKINEFYSSKPPDYNHNDDNYDPNPTKFGLKLCPVCGIHAAKHCSQCSKMFYCSREHQIIHWKKGGHKNQCKNGENTVIHNSNIKYEKFVFPEYEIIIEETALNNNHCNDNNHIDDDDDDENDSNDVDDENEMKKYQEFIDKNKPSFQNENIEQYLSEDNETNDNEQKIFNQFRQATSDGEVIRYNTDWHQQSIDNQFNNILWISAKNRITAVPDCENCGSKRMFEFQIMPNLLNKLNLNKNDHLDFGTLLIFCCAKNCRKNEPKNVLDYYQPEFIYNQMIC